MPVHSWISTRAYGDQDTYEYPFLDPLGAPKPGCIIITYDGMTLIPDAYVLLEGSLHKITHP
jgi:hypothetical protein